MTARVRQYEYSRFFHKYRNFFLLIGFLLVIQAFLAVRVGLLHDKNDSSGDSIGNHIPKPSINPSKVASSHREKDDKERRNGIKNSQNDISMGNKVENQSVNSSLITLDLETLTFVPECEITGKESISAIQRAKTQQCKEQLAKTACRAKEGSLFPKRLPRYCISNETTFGKHIGCFKDDQNARILSEYYALQNEKNSPRTCVDLCLQSGFQFAGVQYGVECFCGNVPPDFSLKLEDTDCMMKCPFEDPVADGNQWKHENQFCGGYYTMNIYETGVFHDANKKIPVVGFNGINEHDGTTVKPKKTVRIVFFLTLNGRALRQVVRLIKSLFHERHYFYIHVDARQDYLYRELLVLSHKLPNNIRFMQNRKATIWGGASLLTMLLSGMQELTLHAKDWNWDWDYVLNLSESDFPLKTTEQLETFLSLNNGKNFVKSHGRDVQKFMQKQGLDKVFDECEYRMWRVCDRKLPNGILMDGGSDWICLHRDFVEYVTTSDDDLLSGLKTVFKYTLLPAESFFHTVLRNSAMCSSFVDNNLHVTNWKRRLGCKCQYRNVVDWCGCSPNDFRSSDWNRLQLTENRYLFFGRKFESIINQGIVNQLESWLYPHRFEDHFSTLDRYWQSLYHHYDLTPKTDDALLTLGYSLSRLATKSFNSKYFDVLPDNNKQKGKKTLAASLDDIKLLEINAYTHDDQFQGILVKFSCQIKDILGTEDKHNFIMEAWFKIESRVMLAPWSQKVAKIRTKIQDLRVGTDYDQKEQSFRNFASAMGPFSEPTLAYNVYTDESFNISFVWQSPNKSVEAIVNVTITDGTTANFVKPVLKTPLHVGIWTVKLLTSGGHLVSQVHFLIKPLEFFLQRPISVSDSKLINGIINLGGENNQSDARESVKEELERKVDDFVSKFYTLQDQCLEKELSDIVLSHWNYKNYDSADGNVNKLHSSVGNIDTSICSHSQWSSLYPDPKSTILGIDPRNGLLMP